MIERKKKPGLKSNPALPLIGFKTTTKTEDDDHVDVHYRKRLEVNGTHLHLYLFVDRSADQTRGMLKRTEPFLRYDLSLPSHTSKWKLIYNSQQENSKNISKHKRTLIGGLQEVH